MFSFLFTILVLGGLLGLLVGIHEFGHFFAAKKAGVWVQEFAIGFGKTLFERKYGDTVYKFNLIPLGGYVKLYGERRLVLPLSIKKRLENASDKQKTKLEEIIKKEGLNTLEDDDILEKKINSLEVSKTEKKLIKGLELFKRERIEDSRKYVNKSYLQKAFIITAGVIMNFILGALIYMMYLGFVGGEVFLPKVVNYDFIGVEEQKQIEFFALVSSAEVSLSDELRALDRAVIISLDGEVIEDIQDAYSYIGDNLGKSIDIKFYKDGKFDEGSFTFDLENDPELLENVEIFGYPIVLGVSEGSPAGSSKIQEGDIILSIDGVELSDVSFLIEELDKRRGEEVSFVYMRDGERVEDTVVLDDLEDAPVLGISFAPVGLPAAVGSAYYIDYGGMPIMKGVYHAYNMFAYQAKAMGDIVGSAIFNKEYEQLQRSLSGPIRVGAEINYLIQSNNFLDVVNLTALISLTLAFMNILPIPVLDGGHLLLVSLEEIFGDRLSEKIKLYYNILGLIFILGLTLIVTLNDLWTVFLSRIFS